ncbi:MAG: hypothetical protein ACI39H_04705 [Lachnospiraceae bacterium]
MDQPIYVAEKEQPILDQALFQDANEIKKEKEELRRQKKELEKLKADVESRKRDVEQKRRELERDAMAERQRQEREAKLFEMKWKLLESETANLAKERAEFDNRVQAYETALIEDTSSGSFQYSLLFCGVTNELALKKRYKDLMKIYHPDNIAGDTNVVQEISREYEEMQTQFRTGLLK